MKEQDCLTLSESLQHLKNIVLCFDECKIEYSLDAGSLLKAYRGNDIFKSHDLDIAVFGYNTNALVGLVRRIRDLGYMVRCQGDLPFIEDLFQIKLPGKTKGFMYIDVYIYHKCGDEYIRRCIHKPFPGSFISVNLFLIISKLIRKDMHSTTIFGRFVYLMPYFFRKLLGVALLPIYERFCLTVWNVIPVQYISKYTNYSSCGINFSMISDPERYLEHRYGDNWRVPDSNWDYSDCAVYRLRKPSSCFINKQWIECDSFYIEKHRKTSSKLFDFSKEQVDRILSLDS